MIPAGGGANHDTSSGIFRFYSYRDPNIVETFERAIDWALQGKITDSMLEESLLGIISSIDAPASPAGEVKQTYHHQLFGRTPAHRAQTRANYLAVTLPDLHRVAQKYLATTPARALVTSEARAKEAEPTFELVRVT